MEKEEAKTTKVVKTADGTAGKEVPKKKKYIQVFRPQNASSKETKSMAKAVNKKPAKPEEPEKKMVKVRKADGTIVLVDSSTIKRKPKTVKPAETVKAETPAVINDAVKESAEAKLPEAPAAAEAAPEMAAKAPEAAAKAPAAAAKAPEEAAKAPETETKAPETAAKAPEAPAKAEAAESTAPEKPAETEQKKAPAAETSGSVQASGQEKAAAADKSPARAAGSQDDRKHERTERQGAERGERKGQREPKRSDNLIRTDNRNRDASRSGGTDTRKPYGTRPAADRTAGGSTRPAFNKDRQGAEERTGRAKPAGSDFRKRSDDRRAPAAAAPDLGLKKNTGRAGNKDNKAKDKNKDNLRDNKFNNDKMPGNRPNQGKKQHQQLPKALQKPAHKAPEEKKEEVVTEITLPEKITIRELAEKMKMQPAAIVKKLFMQGTMVTVNQEVDFETAQEIALTFDIIAEQEEKVDVIEELLREEEENEKDMTARPPVVCVMGHVDHGKTSLLDAIRDTHVTDREAGGITQHIGAYVVPINGQKITFLDTPGHEAFTAMRMRGANSTDIAILVVAADDGVMPQTIEAINHAKAAGVEIIVAINKIDKPGANIDRVKQELTEYGLVSEDWGGSTVFVPVSAKTHEGIENLLEMILLTAEVLELKANKKRKARGLVLEAKLDKGKGPVANVLVQKGTLKLGDYIAAGSCSGKVRAMMDENGRQVKQAGPSTPVEILGLNGVPNAGEIIVAFDTDKEAKSFAATFVAENKNKLVEDTKAKMSLDDVFSKIKEGNLKELNIIVKADVQGSVEAMKTSLLKLSNEEVVVKIIHGGVGAINESDITLAATSEAIVIGFNVRPDAQAKATAEEEGVDVRLYKVIYQAIEDVDRAMKGMLDPIYEEKVIGHAEIRQIFKASGIGNIAGSYVLDGIFQRDCKIRITREGKQIYEGQLASLKRFKDDVKEVKAGFECGLVFDGFGDIAEFDQVEAYIMVEVPRA